MPTSQDDPLAAHGATPGELRARIEAEREGEPFLVFRDGEGAQRLVTLGRQRTRICIGRSPGNDIALAWDTEVSRLHAELERLGDEWTVTDDGLSRNGSFLNGRRVTARSRLRDGDVLRVGRTTLAYRVPEAPDSRPTRAAGDQGARAARADGRPAAGARRPVPTLRGGRAGHTGHQPADHARGGQRRAAQVAGAGEAVGGVLGQRAAHHGQEGGRHAVGLAGRVVGEVGPQRGPRRCRARRGPYR